MPISERNTQVELKDNMEFEYWYTSLRMAKSGDEDWRALPQHNSMAVEIKYEIFFSMRLMFRGHLQWQSDLDLRFISGENLGCEDQKVEHP